MFFRYCSNFIQSGPKMAQFFWYALTSSNINRFSKLFHYQNQEKMYNNTITKDPTTPQVCRYTTLWNFKCLKNNNWKRDDFCINTFLKKLTRRGHPVYYFMYIPETRTEIAWNIWLFLVLRLVPCPPMFMTIYPWHFEQCCSQTDRQTDQQTDRQTDCG